MLGILFLGAAFTKVVGVIADTTEAELCRRALKNARAEAQRSGGVSHYELPLVVTGKEAEELQELDVLRIGLLRADAMKRAGEISHGSADTLSITGDSLRHRLIDAVLSEPEHANLMQHPTVQRAMQRALIAKMAAESIQ